MSTHDSAGAIRAILAEHDWLTPRGYAWPCCTCGEEFPDGEEAAYAHVAEALAPLIAGREAKAWGQGYATCVSDFDIKHCPGYAPENAQDAL